MKLTTVLLLCGLILFFQGFTPIILAATGGHVNVVELLLNHGANIEAQSDRTKDTALSLACSGGRKEVSFSQSNFNCNTALILYQNTKFHVRVETLIAFFI